MTPPDAAVSEDRLDLRNEACDELSNAIQWIRNVADGTSSVDAALLDVRRGLERIRTLAPSLRTRPSSDLAGIASADLSTESARLRAMSKLMQQCGHMEWGDDCARVADAIDAVLRTRPAGDRWQPIETAPREWRTDGTGVTILVSLPATGALKDPGMRRVYEARWNELDNAFTSVNGFVLLRDATHWQPMPAPYT